MNRYTHAFLWILGVLTLVGAGAALADEFEISRWSIDGGGIMQSTGGDFELSSSIGQPDAGTMSGGDFDLTGGFWFPLATGDCNSDGGVSLWDYSDLEYCLSLSGPEVGPVSGDCRCFDVDRDDDVDLADAAEFQESFTG
jgi:hypothetical protein